MKKTLFQTTIGTLVISLSLQALANRAEKSARDFNRPTGIKTRKANVKLDPTSRTNSAKNSDFKPNFTPRMPLSTPGMPFSLDMSHLGFDVKSLRVGQSFVYRYTITNPDLVSIPPQPSVVAKGSATLSVISENIDGFEMELNFQSSYSTDHEIPKFTDPQILKFKVNKKDNQILEVTIDGKTFNESEIPIDIVTQKPIVNTADVIYVDGKPVNSTHTQIIRKNSTIETWVAHYTSYPVKIVSTWNDSGEKYRMEAELLPEDMTH